MSTKAPSRTYFLVRGKRYDMPEEMTGREFRFIKQETGHLGGEIEDALNQGDTDLMLALIVVAMRRVGEDATLEGLLDLKVGREGDIEVMEESGVARPTEASDDAPSAPPAGKRGRRSSSASTD